MRLVICAVLGIVLGCSSTDPPADEDRGFAFEAFTYDVAALPDSGGKWDAERSAALPGELARSDADVLCVNGLYDDALRAAVLGATTATFPYRVDLQTDETTPIDDPRDATGSVPPPPEAPACSDADAPALEATLACVSAKCSDGDRVASGGCIDYGACAGPRSALARASATCTDCFQNCAELSACTLAETRTRCTAPSKGVPLAYRGRHGTMLLSRHPLTGEGRVVLPATERRVVLHAAVALPLAPPVEVFCFESSWTPDRPNDQNPRYRGAYGGGDPVNGWFREHAFQGARVVELVKNLAGARPAVVLGHLWASPLAKEEGEYLLFPYNAEGLLPFDRAFVEAIPVDSKPFCTLCGDDNDVAWDAIQWTTHIYLWNLGRDRVQKTHRTFMGRVVRTGETRNPYVQLSPYYGVRARVEVGP